MTYQWRTNVERESYVFLHSNGLAAFEAKYPGGVVSKLINEWDAAKICRISFPNGNLTVKTFAKYAK